MKKYNLSVTGNVEINTFGDLKVDGATLLDEFKKSFGLSRENYDSKQFAGKVEITITDFTEPLVIETSEDRRMEGCDDVCGMQAKPL